MAAPTSSNEVTARRLASFATSLWAKIKTWFVAKSGDTMTGNLTFQKTLRQAIIGTGTASSSSSGTYYPAKWKFDLGVATPTAGDQMVIKLPVAGSDYGVYISTDNGTTYFPVARHTGASRLTAQYPSGAYVCVVFEAYVSGSSGSGQVNDIFPVAGGTARTSLTTGCWRVINDYDSGNTICQIRTENGRFYAGSTGCNPYALVCLDKAGKYSMLVSSGSGTGTSKTINTAGKFKFDPVILYYSANNTAAANALVSNTYATFIAHQSVDTRYSHNYTTAFTTNSPLYIECTIDADGYWSPTTKCITQTLTTGNYYIYLGQTYSTAYQVSLSPAHPVYYYDGTDLIDYVYGTFMKPVGGTTTLVSNTAVKVGTVNGADVNLKLPTIPAAANNGALKIGLNGGAASSKFTANQSGDSTLTFASGTTAGTINVDGTEVAVAGWSGKQNDVKYQLAEYGALQYSDITAIISAGKVPVVYSDNSLYVCDGSVYTVNDVNEYRFTKASGNVDSPRIIYLRIRDNSSGWGGGVISLATPSSVTAVANSRFPYYTVDNPNWDDLTAIGEYKVTNSDSTGTAKNSPERGAINARVYNINDGNTPFITQIAVGDDMYYRSKYGNSAWGPWRYFTQSNTVRRIEQGSLGSVTDTLYIV